MTYDNLKNSYISFKYQFVRAKNPIAKTHLLPLPHYHVGPPIELVMLDAEHLPPSDQIIRTVERSHNELREAIKTDMMAYEKHFDAYYSPRVRDESLLLWAQCDYATRERIQLWAALREQLFARSVPSELQHIIRNMALLPQSRQKYLKNVRRISDYNNFIKKGHVVADIDIQRALFVMRPRHLDCLSDYLTKIRHDKIQLMAFMTKCVYYRTAQCE